MNEFVILGEGLLNDLPPDLLGSVPSNLPEFLDDLRRSPWAMGIVPVLSIADARRTASAVRAAGLENLLLGMMRPCGTHKWKAAFLNYGGDQIIPRNSDHALFNQVVGALFRRDRTIDRKVIEFAGFTFGFENEDLSFDGMRIGLSPYEQRLVSAVICAGGKAVPMRKLTFHLESSENTVRQLLAKARRKIRDASGGIDFILSHYAEGYVFLPTGFSPQRFVGADGKSYMCARSQRGHREAAE